MILKDITLPRQGWKIHISCTEKNFQKVLDIVYNFCIKNNISFKFISNESEIRYCISGENSPSQLGKFITIYPINKSEFVFIIKSLYKVLINFDGPYILSDKRYENSNIYYRYGIIESSSDFLIMPNGEKSIDDRSYFKVPYFEIDPFVKNETDIDKEAKYIDKIVFPKKIVHSSSSGNVYSCLYQRENAVLKESRPFVLGVWGTAIDDLKNEVSITNILKGIPGIPKVLKTFKEWENFYVIQESINGDTFANINADITINDDVPIEKIIKESINLIESIHKKKIVVNDISSNNFMLSRKTTPHVWICDFGSSYIFNQNNLSSYLFGATEGYYDENITSLSIFDSDYHKLGYVLMNYIFPSNRLNLLDNTGISSMKQFNMYCKDNKYPTYIWATINLLIKQPKDWKEKIRSLLGEYYNEESLFKELNNENNEDRNILINKIKNFHNEQIKAIQFIEKSASEQYYIIPPTTHFYNILNGFFIPSIIAEIEKSTYFLPSNIIFGGIKNSNLAFLFNTSLKKEFFSRNHLYEKTISDWLSNSNDFTISTGIIGFGIILILSDNNKEFYEVDDYILLIEKRLNKHNYSFEKGEKLGLLDGYLGFAYFEILLYKRKKNNKNLEKAQDILKNVQKYILKINNSDNWYFPKEIDGKFSSAYIKDGLAGFLYVSLELYLCKDISNEIKIDLKNNSILPYIDSLKQEKWTQYPGFLDGLTGIAYVLFKAGKILSNNDLVYDAISILSNIETFTINVDNNSYTPENSFTYFTFDFESGNAGIAYVQKEILKHINGKIIL